MKKQKIGRKKRKKSQTIYPVKVRHGRKLQIQAKNIETKYKNESFGTQIMRQRISIQNYEWSWNFCRVPVASEETDWRLENRAERSCK